MTVREQVRLAANLRGGGDAERGALDVLDALGLSGRLDCLPAELSPSEQQSVALAEAIGARPAILLAEDPLARLDVGAARCVINILRKFAREYDAIIICTNTTSGLPDAADQLVVLATS
jgi:predicted ABC-type transport system involved in lysophospholipase L1 biosynthesis ATPase subunit